MSPTPRAALALAVIALAALIVPLGLVALAGLGLIVASTIDALSVQAAPAVRRSVAPILSRGVPAPIEVEAALPAARRVKLRQVAPPALGLGQADTVGVLHSELTARVRGRYTLPAVGTRAEGRLGLGAFNHQAGGTLELHVYPDLVSARRLALAAREGRLLDARQRARGPFGLGTDFESVREWLPDDDVRHVNWPATQRLGHPMSNQYRLEQARDLICMVDAGRLMAAPLDERTRLDAALDAVAAVALAADELGDHCGTIAFDSDVRVHVRPRRGSGRRIVRALFDLQPRPIDSDYERAFRIAAGGKRALVLVITDLFDDAAARALIDAVPVLARRHAVIVGSVTEPDFDRLLTDGPETEAQVYELAAALDLLDARRRAATMIRAAGARVVEAAPDRFSAACVRAYLHAKATLRL